MTNSRHRRLHRLDHAGGELGLIERLAATVALDHPRQQQFGRLESGEAFATIQALAPASDLAAVAGQTRVRYPSVGVIAERAMHAWPASAPITRRIPGIAGTTPALPLALSAPRHPLPRHR